MPIAPTRPGLATLFAALGLGLSIPTLAAAQPRPATVWIEGEAAQQADVDRHSWYNQVKKDQLSGGDWLSNFGNSEPGEATYRFQVREPGAYRFYARVNPTRAGYRYRLDGGDWQTVDTAAAFDSTNIAANDQPDLRFIGWAELGAVDLSRGSHTLTLRIEGGHENHGAIDAVVFTQDDAWTPAGATRPGAPRPRTRTPGGTWAWEPVRDRFSDRALLDLRHLNEDVAGQHGFISVDDKGNFVRGDGEPIRFWAINSGVWNSGMDALKDHAKFIAKRGVNMVRYHGHLNNESGPLHSIREDSLDKLWQLVAAMKDEGVYVTLSPYYPHATRGEAARRNWGIPRNPEAGNPTGLLFFDPELQAAYKEWLRQILLPENPYTGIPLKDEPAIAIFQIQNEDSLLFWTFSSIGGDDLDILRKQYGDWLRKKYGSLDRALAAWDGAAAAGSPVPDDPQQGLMSFVGLWQTVQPDLNQGGLGRRMTDQARFITETMRAWNAEVERFLREEIGSEHIVNAGNWRTADAVRLGDLERYSYDANAVIGMNRYTGGMHEGDNSGWAIIAGQRFTDPSVLQNPGKLAVAVKQPRGKAFIFPEGNWVPPLSHQSEGPFLIAAYGSLTGADAHYWFATRDNQWRPPSSSNGYLPSLGKWVIATPEIMGNFPAAALMYRQGYIQQGEPAVVEHRSLQDLWERRPPVISEEGAFDPNRDRGFISARSPVQQEIDRLAFLVGPVQVVYDSDASRTEVGNLAEYIHKDEQVVESNTGQLRWNYGDGIATLDAPKAQGVTGFLNKEGRFELSDVTVESQNDYATVAVVSMDDRPLAESAKVLVQIGTVARPLGWETREVSHEHEGETVQAQEIVSFGQAPWVLQNNEASITIRNSGLARAVALDANGMPGEDVPLEQTDGGVRLTLPPDTKYVVLLSGDPS